MDWFQYDGGQTSEVYIDRIESDTTYQICCKIRPGSFRNRYEGAERSIHSLFR